MKTPFLPFPAFPFIFPAKRWICLPAIIACFELPAQPADLKFDRFDRWANAPQGNIHRIHQDEQGFLWCHTPSAGYRFDGHEFELFPPDSCAARRQEIAPQLSDASGNCWWGSTSLQCSVPDHNGRREFQLPAGSGQCRALFFHPALTSDSILWMLADSALLCFDISRRQFVRQYRNRPHDLQSLYGAPFRTAFFSREGILWLGGENGFCKYDWRNQEFRLYKLNAGEPAQGGEVNFVLGVKDDPSKCWITTNDMGLLQYDLHEHRILPEKINGELRQLTRRNTYGLAYDKPGRLWVGNTDRSIFVCDLKKNRIVRQIPLNNDLIHFVDTDFKRGRFWYILSEENRSAMIRIIPETMKMDTFRIPYWQERKISITSWLHDQEGTAWLLNGNRFLEYFNTDPYRLEQKRLQDIAGLEQLGFNLKSLRPDAERKVLWLAGSDALAKIDWEKSSAVIYPNRDKRPEVKHTRIEVDRLGRVWLQCTPENALYKFDPVKETFARYDWSDGLPDAKVEAVEVDRVGEKWGQRYHDHSFMLFDPLKIPVIPANPPLITGVQPAGQQQFVPVGELSTRLRSHKNSLRITFTSVSFEQGAHLRFRYHLGGLDTVWVNAGADRTAYYRDLPAGDYHFQVMVANREGDWHPVPAAVSFTVPPPFYARAGFQVPAGLCLLAVIYALARSWENRRKKKYELRRRIAEDLNEQVGMALNSIRSWSLGPAGAAKETDLLERISQQALQATKKLNDLVWLINPENDTFTQFVTRIREDACAQLAPLGIVPVIRVDKQARQANIPIEQRKDLYLNFKKVLAESISRQHLSEVYIHITRENHRLKIGLHRRHRLVRCGSLRSCRLLEKLYSLTMLRLVFLFFVFLQTARSSAQMDDLGGYWLNEQGLGANWAQWEDRVWYISIQPGWKEYFEGRVRAPDRLEGRLVKIDLHTGVRQEGPLILVNSAPEELTVISPAAEDSSFTATRSLHRLGFYSQYERLSQPTFEERHRAWEINSWFQDGDTLISIFYDFGDLNAYEKGVFISADSVQALRYLSFQHNTCRTREFFQYHLQNDKRIYVRFRDIDGGCGHDTVIIRSGYISDRMSPTGRYPVLDRQEDTGILALPPSWQRAHATAWISAFEVNGYWIPLDASAVGAAPELVSNRQDLAFHVSASPPETKLYYQLQGYDAGRLPAPADRRITYSHLPPGDYEFKLATDLISAEAVVFRLRVTRPFFLNLPFYLLSALGAAVFIGAGFWWRERRRRQQEALRRHIARELHDDIGSTLGSISILAAVARRQAPEGSAQPALEVIGKKAREALDNISDIIWSSDTRRVSLENTLQRMKEFTVETLDAQDVKVYFTADPALLSLPLDPEKCKDLYLLFKEAVNNTARYAQAQQVWVTLEKTNKGIFMEIRDDGVGFDPETVKRGDGLNNIRTRAGRLGGQLTLGSTPERGTHLQLAFPV